MIEHLNSMDEDEGEEEARRLFETEIGTTGVPTRRTLAGNKEVVLVSGTVWRLG